MKTKENKARSKKKQVRSLIMMMLITVLLLSSATYAWFTLNNNAKLSTLALSVGDVTGLEIAWKSTDTFSQEITNSSKPDGKFLPATTVDGKTFLKPVYTDGEVTGTLATGDGDALTDTSTSSSVGYYYTKDFYLRAKGTAGEKTKVYLTAKGANPTSCTVASSTNFAGSAVRISLTAGSDTIVYEPNSDSTETGTAATDARASKTAVSSTDKMKIDKTWATNTGYLELTNGTATKVTLCMWIEGTDAQCVNEIEAKSITSNLKFSTEKD